MSNFVAIRSRYSAHKKSCNSGKLDRNNILMVRRTPLDMNTLYYPLDVSLRQCAKNYLLCSAAVKKGRF